MSDMAIREAVRRFSVDEYHRMADAGVLESDERVELLDGQIVHLSPIGDRHWLIHAQLVRYLNEMLPGHVIVGQGSFPLGDRNEPQPDVAILAEPAATYWTRRSTPSDLLVTIELADSSLARDLGPKRTLYARFDIPDYVVVDIDREVVIHHCAPNEGTYARVARHSAGTTFRFLSLPTVSLSASAFLKEQTERST